MTHFTNMSHTRCALTTSETRHNNIESIMAYKAIKTEHAGAKHGNGAYWGPKKDAKKESNKIRRRNWKKSVDLSMANS